MTQPRQARPETMPPLDCGLSAFVDRYDLILCDVWGVLHNGVTHFPQAVGALRRFRDQGGTVVLITNAPAPARNVMSRMQSVGVPSGAYDAVATSGDVTSAMIVEAGCPPLFNIGPARELDLYKEAAQAGPCAPRLVDVTEAELVVAISLSDDIGRDIADYEPLLAIMRARDLPMICANPDIVVEVGDTLVYCAGAIAERYEQIGGTVVQAGKPFSPIYARAMQLAHEKVGPVPKSRILAIGDAMHTDMRGAEREGIDALFITSGIHRDELHGTARGNPIDQAALRQFLDASPVRAPIAALPVLRWSP